MPWPFRRSRLASPLDAMRRAASLNFSIVLGDPADRDAAIEVLGGRLRDELTAEAPADRRARGDAAS